MCIIIHKPFLCSGCSSGGRRQPSIRDMFSQKSTVPKSKPKAKSKKRAEKSDEENENGLEDDDEPGKVVKKPRISDDGEGKAET